MTRSHWFVKTCSWFMKIALPLDGTSVARVREASALVFKSNYQLEILVLMAQEERFYHGQILAKVPGSGGSFVTGLLNRYAVGGMIDLIPPNEDGQARKYYEKRQPEDPFWALVPSWAEFLMADSWGADVARLVRP